MYDLNVKVRHSDRDRASIVKRATELGWCSITWNTCIVGKISSTKVKLSPPVSLPRTDHEDVSLNRALATSNETISIEQLNRITITIDDVHEAQTLTSGNDLLKQFDIVAVCPGNAKVFSYLCKSAEIDLICIDFTHKVPFALNKKLLDEAVKRGIFFEIVYGPMLHSPAVRREICAGTRVFLQFLRGNNLILSSGCESINTLRGPFDAVNIGQVLKLSEEQAKRAISNNCEALLNHSTSRRLKFLPVELTSLDSFSQRSNLFTKRSSISCEDETEERRKKIRWTSAEKLLDGNDNDEDNSDGSESDNIKTVIDDNDGVWQF